MLNGLLIRSPFIDMILEGSKTWEMRGSRTGKRGRVALIQSGTGTVIGVADLVGVVGPLSVSELAANASKAGFEKHEKVTGLPYERTFAWVLQNAGRLNEPVPYAHPYGAVIWVNLAPAVEQAVLQQVRKGLNPEKPVRKSGRHFRVTIYYKDGDIWECDYPSKAAADKVAIEQRKHTLVVKRVTVTEHMR